MKKSNRRLPENEDLTLKGMEFLCQKYTLEYYAKYIEDYRAGLSSIEFAQLELDKNRKKLQLEIEYVNPNAITFYRHFVGVIESYLKEHQSKQLPSYPPISINKSNTEQEKNYSLRQVAIAYAVMGVQITNDNASEILNKHTIYRSVSKLLAKRVYRVNDLINTTGNKTVDTKHLKNLEAAKRLISGMKNKEMEKSISCIITAFQNNFNTTY